MLREWFDAPLEATHDKASQLPLLLLPPPPPLLLPPPLLPLPLPPPLPLPLPLPPPLLLLLPPPPPPPLLLLPPLRSLEGHAARATARGGFGYLRYSCFTKKAVHQRVVVCGGELQSFRRCRDAAACHVLSIPCSSPPPPPLPPSSSSLLLASMRMSLAASNFK